MIGDDVSERYFEQLARQSSAVQPTPRAPATPPPTSGFLSLSLGIFNLLPIPVLDGGHLLFFLIEGVLRRPLPLRARELMHIVGMGILLCLMLLAFKNDVERRWDGIISPAKTGSQ